jgi:hypothetical protein
MKIVLFVWLSIFGAYAANFGGGITLGTDTGLSSNYHMNNHQSILSSLSWGANKTDLFSMYTWRHDKQFKVDIAWMGFFYGAGVNVQLLSGKAREKNDDNDSKIGLAGGLGAYHHFEKAPVEVGLYFAPTMFIVPESKFGGKLELYAHYYF